MGILVHKGWTNVDLSWNQLLDNLPKIFEPFLEIWVCPILGLEAHFWPKNLLFYVTPIQPPFFGLGLTRFNGIIFPPYPEVALDTFGFPVGVWGSKMLFSA